MGKYENLQKAVFSIFDKQAWKDKQIKTYPSNFIAIDAGNEFVKISIVPSGTGINIKSAAGVLIIDIYTSAGNGPTSSALIADALNEFLESNTISVAVGIALQFGSSSMMPIGVDKDKPSLFRTQYTVPFNYFGVN